MPQPVQAASGSLCPSTWLQLHPGDVGDLVPIPGGRRAEGWAPLAPSSSAWWVGRVWRPGGKWGRCGSHRGNGAVRGRPKSVCCCGFGPFLLLCCATAAATHRVYNVTPMGFIAMSAGTCHILHFDNQGWTLVWTEVTLESCHWFGLWLFWVEKLLMSCPLAAPWV